MKTKIKKHHVYKFIGYKDEVLYVGRSSNLKIRLETHDNLPKECYSNIDRIEIIEFDSEYDMCHAEGYFIDFYNPIYNSKQEKFDNSYSLDLWTDYKMKSKVGSVLGRYSKKSDCNLLHIVENILLKNVPIDIRNLMFFYKNNMSLKNLKDVVEELNSKLNFDGKDAMVDINYNTKVNHNSWEFSQDLSFGFVNGRLKFSCEKDSYVPDDFSDFYYIDLIDMYNVLISLMNFYYNPEKFKYAYNKIYNLEECYIPVIRNGVLITSRNEFIEMCDEELKYRLDLIEKYKINNPTYLIKK